MSVSVTPYLTTQGCVTALGFGSPELPASSLLTGSSLLRSPFRAGRAGSLRHAPNLALIALIPSTSTRWPAGFYTEARPATPPKRPERLKNR